MSGEQGDQAHGGELALPAAQTDVRPISRTAGYVAAILALLLIPVGVGSIQALGDVLPPFQLNLWRFIPQLVLSFPVLFYRGAKLSVARSAVPFMCAVCAGINILNWTTFASSRYLAVGTLTGIHSTIYLTATAFVTVVMYRECPAYSVLAVLHCIAGGVLIAQPRFVFGGSQHGRGELYHPLCANGPIGSSYAVNATSAINGDDALKTLPNGEQGPEPKPTLQNLTTADREALDPTIGYVYITVSALIFTLVNFTINKGLGHVDPFVTSSWVSLSGVLISLLGMLVMEKPVLPSADHCQALLVVHAVAVGLANVFQFLAMVAVPPLAYAIIISLRLPLLFCAQYTVLRSVSPGHRNGAEVAGAALVFVGNLVGPLYKTIEKLLQRRKQRKKHKLAFGKRYEMLGKEDNGEL